ncbi:MAG TPA: septum formation protein Maf, partial [Rhodospirillaceae bacterium]|nr:septum formation protein Maf [Rhodospirillaceae bacterium]
QTLDCEGRHFDKPNDHSAAKKQLLALRGRRHRLVTAVAAATAGDGVVWSHCEEAGLTMRPFSDAFAERYLAQAGDAVLSSVGAYQLEGLGAQLFSRVEGDFFAILGLPLLPLLDFLRHRGELSS